MEATLGRILDTEVEGAINLRDIGGYQAEGGRVRTGRIYRSAMTQHLTDGGLAALSDALGIRTVVDLRNAGELEADGIAAFERAGIEHRNFPVTAQTAMTQAQQEQRMAAFREGTIDWRDLYSQMAASGAEAFRELFALAAKADHAILFHCTGGRDRTGISAALLLSSVGVDDRDIAYDYALTGEALAPHIARFERNMREMQLSEEQWRRLVTTTPEPVNEFLAGLRAEHGTVAGYLESIGVPASIQDELRERLVA